MYKQTLALCLLVIGTQYIKYRAITLISHASKVMLKILQARLQQYLNLQIFKLDLEKAEEPDIKLPTSVGSLIKQESFRKTCTSALLTMPKPLTLENSSGHLTCLLRKLYAGHEATVRIGHGTTDWFQIGKGVRRSCIFHPAYLTYMQSTS